MPPAEIVSGDVAGLEDALADAILSARSSDRLAPVTVLVGHVLLRPYLRRMLATRGIAQINVRFVQAHELAEELASGALDASRPRLTAAARALLVREAAEGAGGYFSAVAGRDGFVEALARLFRDLELGAISAVELGHTAEKAKAVRAANASKLDELARLYGIYVERRSAFLAAPDFFAAADPSRFEGALLVYGLWDKPQEAVLRLIERIAAPAAVTVFLPRSGLDADDATTAIRERMIALGASRRELKREPGGGSLEALPQTLFTNAAIDAGNGRGRNAGPSAGDRTAPNGDVALASAPDTVREVWEAARACLRWAEEGIRFHEMAVVYRNRDPYAPLVDEIFREAGIETYLHDGRALASHPLGKRLLALIALASTDTFSRVEVMEFLTETRVSAELRATHPHFRPSEWERFTREAGIVEGADQWNERLTRLADEKRELAKLEGQEWRLGHVERVEALRTFAAEFASVLAAHPAEATWDEHLAYVRELAPRFATGTEPIVGALAELTSLSAVVARPTFEVFCRAVRDDLERRDVTRVLGEPVREFGKRGVAVLDATSLRQLRFRAVYMLGVAERAWPPPPRPDPLLLEHERRAINDSGAGMLPLRTEPDGEPLTFWLDVQAAREHLGISYARADAGRSGKHLPSYFFRAVVDALERRSVPISEVEQSPWVRRFSAGRLAADALDESLSQAEYDRGLIRASVMKADEAAVAALVADTPAFGLAIEARRERWSRGLTPFDGVMSAAAALAAARNRSSFARGDAVSPSRLETYATCPYRYFLKYTLGVEPLLEPEAIERIDPLERGSLIHAILERFLRGLGRGDMPRRERRGEHLALLMEAAHAEEREREARGVTGRALIWAIDQRQIEEDLVRWYDAEVADAGDGLIPGAFEASFGPIRYGLGEEDDEVSTDEPLLVEAEGRRLALQGRIDRIDWDEARTRFRVIDYKTGSVREKAAFDKGKALQLPIYLLAAARALEIDAEQGEAQYFYVSSKGGFKRRIFTGEDLAGRRPEFERVLATIADGIDTGMFAPNPEKDRWNCKWCDYADVCDQRIDGIMQLKSDDQRGDAYRAMEAIS